MGQAVGIPNTADFGDLDALQPGHIYDICIQRHHADRAGEHLDFRIGNEDIGLLSWALPKAELPEPNKKVLAVLQPLHDYSYKDFEGRIEEGYGKGTVKLEKLGKVLVTDKSDDAIHLTIISDRYPSRYVLIRPKSWHNKDWLILNSTPNKPVDYEKIHMKSINSKDEIEEFINSQKEPVYASPKIDGAHVIILIKDGKLEVFSYRISKVHGANILHTERLFTIRPKVNIDSSYDNTILKGELYAVYDDGSVVPVNELSGLLNSSIYKTYQDVVKKKIRFKIGLFDIYRYGNHYIDPKEVPYPERLQMVEKILPYLHKKIFHIIRPVEGREKILSLWDEVASGKHPLTQEGIVLYPHRGLPIKVKTTKEKDVYIREIFRGTGKYSDSAGGFSYSLTPNGPIVGHVGTGFDDDFRKELWENKEDYIGRRARVKYLEQLPSGALRAPVFIALHEDYPNPMDKNASIKAFCEDERILCVLSDLYEFKQKLSDKKFVETAFYEYYGFPLKKLAQYEPKVGEIPPIFKENVVRPVFEKYYELQRLFGGPNPLTEMFLMGGLGGLAGSFVGHMKADRLWRETGFYPSALPTISTYMGILIGIAPVLAFHLSTSKDPINDLFRPSPFQKEVSRLLEKASNLVYHYANDFYKFDKHQLDVLVKLGTQDYYDSFSIADWQKIVARVDDLSPWERLIAVGLPLTASIFVDGDNVKVGSVALVARNIGYNPLVGSQLGIFAKEVLSTSSHEQEIMIKTGYIKYRLSGIAESIKYSDRTYDLAESWHAYCS